MDRAIFTHATHPDRIPANERIRLVYDGTYESHGSFAYDTEAETRAAEEHEAGKLARSEWVALGRIHERVCPSCKQYEITDSLWGIVVENSRAGDIEAAFDI